MSSSSISSRNFARILGSERISSRSRSFSSFLTKMLPHQGTKKFLLDESSLRPAFGYSFRICSHASLASDSFNEVRIIRFGFSSINRRQMAEPTSPHPPSTRTVLLLMTIMILCLSNRKGNAAHKKNVFLDARPAVMNCTNIRLFETLKPTSIFCAIGDWKCLFFKAVYFKSSIFFVAVDVPDRN